LHHQFILQGQGEIQHVTACCHPVLAPEVYNPQWAEDWEEMYGYNPEKAKQLLAEAGYGPDNPVKVTLYNYRTSGEPEAPLIIEALPQYWGPIGIEATIQDIDTGAVTRLWREKKMQHAVWAKVFSFRPIQERVRTNHSQHSSSHYFDHPFVDQKYEEMLSTSSQEEVNRIGREVADFWYDNY
jgi:ABC-type transport system substrate-binding protein